MSNRVEGVCIIQCNFAFWGMEYTLSTKQGETSQKTHVRALAGKFTSECKLLLLDMKNKDNT